MKEKTLCSFEGCTRTIHAQGLCPRHYRQWRTRDKDMSRLTSLVDKTYDRICSVSGCDDPHYSRGYCQRHYRQRNKVKQGKSGPVKSRNTKIEAETNIEKQCIVPGCTRPIKALGLCNGHYQQYMARGKNMESLTPLRGKLALCDYTDPETGERCPNARQAHGYCQNHMTQYLKADRDASELKPLRKSPERVEKDQAFKALLKKHTVLLAKYQDHGVGARKHALCLRLEDLFASGQNWYDIFQAATCTMRSEEIEDFIYGHMGKFCIRVARAVHDLRLKEKT